MPHHHPVACCSTTNSRGSPAGADARKYLTLESMAFSLHARSSWSLRRLRPAVPLIAMFRARVETVAVIRVSWHPHLRIKQEGKENCIPANTMCKTDFAGAGE